MHLDQHTLPSSSDDTEKTQVEPKLQAERTPQAEHKPQVEASSWWSDMIQAVANKSSSALDFVKKDLSEFTSTVKNDTMAAANKIKSDGMTLNMKEGLSTLWIGTSHQETADNTSLPVSTEANLSTRPHFIDRSKARLHEIQTDSATYTSAPEHVDYEAWCRDDFHINDHKSVISDLLVDSVSVRSIYSELVPSSINHETFWQRYFYKIKALHTEEKRRHDLLERVDVLDDVTSADWGDEEYNEDDTTKQQTEVIDDMTLGQSVAAAQLDGDCSDDEDGRSSVREETTVDVTLCQGEGEVTIQQELSNSANDTVDCISSNTSETSSVTKELLKEWQYDLDTVSPMMTSCESVGKDEGKDTLKTSDNSNDEVGDDWVSWE